MGKGWQALKPIWREVHVELNGCAHVEIEYHTSMLKQVSDGGELAHREGMDNQTGLRTIYL
eukprot:6467273-Amphidinium_carterae.1